MTRTVYEPALPLIGQSPPTPNMYATTAQDLFSTDFGRPRANTQLLWDALGIQSLQRAPSLAPLWSDLSTRGGGFVSADVWQDFRRSSLFQPTTEHLAYQTRLTLGQAGRIVGKVVARGGRWTLKVVGWLLSVPSPTPARVGLAIVKEVGIDIGLDLAERGWRSVLDYLKRGNDEPPPPPPIPGPYPPTAPPSGGFRYTGGGFRFAAAGAGRGADYDFLAFEARFGKDAPPFLVRSGGADDMPRHLMALGADLYR